MVSQPTALWGKCVHDRDKTLNQWATEQSSSHSRGQEQRGRTQTAKRSPPSSPETGPWWWGPSHLPAGRVTGPPWLLVFGCRSNWSDYSNCLTRPLLSSIGEEDTPAGWKEEGIRGGYPIPTVESLHLLIAPRTHLTWPGFPSLLSADRVQASVTLARIFTSYLPR